MKCPRCSGYMEIIYHFDEECNQKFLECLNCGEVIDPIILKNRKRNLKEFNYKNQPRRSFKIQRKFKSLSLS